MALSGHCLCGSVRFTARVTDDEVGACHCSMCRRQASGPMFAVLAVGAISFEGEENIARYRSSDWGERGFCRVCGTKLYFRLVEQDAYHVSPTAFDDQERWKFVEEIFIDEKPGFYAFANQTRKLTGPEFVAAVVGREAAKEQAP